MNSNRLFLLLLASFSISYGMQSESLWIADNELPFADPPIFSWVKNPKDIDLLKNALREGADPNQDSKDEGTLLQIATYYNNHEAIELLLAYKADINKVSSLSYRPVPLAISCTGYYKEGEERSEKRKKTILLLLEDGADVNALSNGKWMPLTYVFQSAYATTPTERFFIKKLLLWGARCDVQVLKRIDHRELVIEMQQRIITIVTKLFSCGTVAGGIRLPRDIVTLMVGYCYPRTIAGAHC